MRQYEGDELRHSCRPLFAHLLARLSSHNISARAQPAMMNPVGSFAHTQRWLPLQPLPPHMWQPGKEPSFFYLATTHRNAALLQQLP